jgi:hypothetical protein
VSVPIDGAGDPVDAALEAFYRDVLYEIGEFGRRKSATGLGAAVVVKRVAKAHRISNADGIPLPRLNRNEREERGESEWRRQQGEQGSPTEVRQARSRWKRERT